MNPRQKDRRTRILGIWSLLFFVFLISPTLCAAVDWDWRAYPGNANLPAGNYVTPIRDQGSVGSCWAFAATAALEAKYAITYKITNPTIDLSEQNLICAGVEKHFGNKDSGLEYRALDYMRTNGIVTEAKMPYLAQNTSPEWPLTVPYTLYKITEDNYFLYHNTPGDIKTWVTSFGPIVGAILTNTDWYWPTSPPEYTSAFTFGATTSSFDGEVSLDDLAPTSGINHAILITGFTDDDNVSGGGYFHIKNSWGANWGDHGYGYVAYSTMLQGDHRLSAIGGSAYFVVVPEPSELSIFIGLAVLGLVMAYRWRMRAV